MPKRKKATTATPPPPPPGLSTAGVTEGENNTTHTEVVKTSAEVIVQESETTTVTSMQVSVDCPVMQLPNDAYAKRRVDVILSRKAAEGWRAYAHGLEKREAQLASGKFVRGTSDAVRFLGEQLAELLQAAGVAGD